MPAYFPILLGAHIILAVSLILPSILLPFALRTRRATVESDNGVVRGLLWAQTHGTLAIGAGLALTGLGLIARARIDDARAAVAAAGADRSTSSTSGSPSSSSGRTSGGWSASGPRTMTGPGSSARNGSGTCRT